MHYGANLMFQARFKVVSNLADWESLIQMTDRATGDLLDLTGGSMPLIWSIEARLQGERYLRPWLSAASNDGSGSLTVQGPGLLRIWFPAAVMSAMTPGSYIVTLIVTDGTLTRQIWAGLLPVIGKDISIGQGYSLGGAYYGGRW